jgi:hypothetical protein
MVSFYYSSYHNAVSVSDVVIVWLRWLMKWKGYGRTQSWSNWRYYPVIFVERLRKTIKRQRSSVPETRFQPATYRTWGGVLLGSEFQYRESLNGVIRVTCFTAFYQVMSKHWYLQLNLVTDRQMRSDRWKGLEEEMSLSVSKKLGFYFFAANPFCLISWSSSNSEKLNWGVLRCYQRATPVVWLRLSRDCTQSQLMWMVNTG